MGTGAIYIFYVVQGRRVVTLDVGRVHLTPFRGKNRGNVGTFFAIVRVRNEHQRFCSLMEVRTGLGVHHSWQNCVAIRFTTLGRGHHFLRTKLVFHPTCCFTKVRVVHTQGKGVSFVTIFGPLGLQKLRCYTGVPFGTYSGLTRQLQNFNVLHFIRPLLGNFGSRTKKGHQVVGHNFRAVNMT